MYRHEDAVLGLRTIPSSENPLKGKVEINGSAIFTVDVEKKVVQVKEGDKVYPIGDELIYQVGN